MPPKSVANRNVVIAGAGPAGLTAAWELSKHGVPAVVLEADNTVGGLSRTVDYKGYLFDIGGHRFFTKWQQVDEIWREVLGGDFLERPRLSRIFYRNKFFHYPLRPFEALLSLGFTDTVRVLASYGKSRLFPGGREQNLEEWVSNRFGRRLYEIFFKTYTEKVWGVPCTEIRAEWAAQRIQGLSLGTAIRSAFGSRQQAQIKTLIGSFRYPRRGPGQMWQAMTDQLQRRGYPVLLERQVKRILHDETGVAAFETDGPAGRELHRGTHFISSMPMRELVQALDPPAPLEVRQAAAALRYRDFLIVSLVLNRANVMPDNWIYVHEPSVRVGRIQNFKNWSPDMVPDRAKTCLGLEYFVFEDDRMWRSSDADLLGLARRELTALGLASPEEIEDGAVVRMPKAYPMYDSEWQTNVSLIREYLEQTVPNLQLVGRNGMHKYNNQDHSMMTALCAARNVVGARYDLWAINSEPEYHEHKKDGKEPVLVQMEPRTMPHPERFRTSGADDSKTTQAAAS